MSMLSAGDLPQVTRLYAAAFARFESPGTPNDEATGPGGGLGAAVEHHGLAPLAAALPAGCRVTLADPGVSLDLAREGAIVVMRVAWDDGPSYEERLDVPPSGLVLLRGLTPFQASPAQASPAQASLAQGTLGGAVLAAPTAVASTASTPLPVPDPLDALHRTIHVPLSVCDGAVCEASPGSPTVPAISVGSLGSAAFRAAHGVRAAYVVGAMAGGITSAEMVVALGKAGLLGFFGSGGLPVPAVEQALADIKAGLGEDPLAGANLLHNPDEPSVEDATVQLYLDNGIRRVSASAFMRLTTAIVRYRLTGIHRDPSGRVVCPNMVFAKVSRPEVAEPFMRPAPRSIVDALIGLGFLTHEQAVMAGEVPMAEDVTAEADSGGHTDRRPLMVLLPTLLRLRDRVMAEEGYAARGIGIRVGAAGGLGDPTSVAGALGMGADYVLTGSINQSCREAGTSEIVRRMLAEAGMADCTTGPAPDMFELGAKVQVLGLGTLYAQRAGRLYDLYKRYPSIMALPEAERARLEKTIFRRPLDEVWRDTRAYWGERDAAELARADADPHYAMALTFRWYLGMTSRWARVGDASRRRDFQIWCGPSMGLFNDWVRDTPLEPLSARGVVDVAWALLHGAAAARRASIALALGAQLPPGATTPAPQLAGG